MITEAGGRASETDHIWKCAVPTNHVGIIAAVPVGLLAEMLTFCLIFFPRWKEHIKTKSIAQCIRTLCNRIKEAFIYKQCLAIFFLEFIPRKEAC